MKEVNFVNPPHYDEISVTKLWPRLSEDLVFMKYMPSSFPKGKHCDRSYFFNIFNTLYEDRMKAMIDHANEVRFTADKDGITQDDVVVSDEYWQALNLMPYFSRKFIV